MEAPSEKEISQTIGEIKRRLNNPDIMKPVNRPVKEGYTEVHNILVEKRTTYDGIETLDTEQARAIAVLGVDYLLGDCTQKVLVNVPLKK